MEKNRSAASLAIWFSGFFGLGALVHLVRLLLRVPVTVGHFEIPLWASLIPLIVFGALSIGLLVWSCKKSCDSSR